MHNFLQLNISAEQAAQTLLKCHVLLVTTITEVDDLQGVPPTGGEGETMVTP